MRPAPLVLALLLGIAGCGGGTPEAAAPTKRPLPAYAGHATELFDDAIEPKAVGLDLDQSSSARADPLMRERAQLSDAVVRARVSTITGKADGPSTSYQVGFKVLDVLAGSHTKDVTSGGEEFVARFDRTSPSIGILKGFEGRLVGKTMVVFTREFVRPDGDVELHVHVAGDTKDVLDAVKEAIILDEVGARPVSPTSKP